MAITIDDFEVDLDGSFLSALDSVGLDACQDLLKPLLITVDHKVLNHSTRLLLLFNHYTCLNLWALDVL